MHSEVEDELRKLMKEEEKKMDNDDLTHAACRTLVHDIRVQIRLFQAQYENELKRELIDWQFKCSLDDMLELLAAMEKTIPEDESFTDGLLAEHQEDITHGRGTA